MANELIHTEVGTVLLESEFDSTTGHSLNNQATGDLIYASSSSQLRRLAIGSGVLTVSGGIPAWSTTLPAVTLGGAVTINGQVFDAGAGGVQINTTGASVGFLVQSTNDSASGGRFEFYHLSASPAVNDILAFIDTRGKESLGNDFAYHSTRYIIENATDGAEAGAIQWYNTVGGSWNLAMTLSGAGALWTDLSVDTLTYKVSGTQVVGARVVDVRADDAANSGDATTDGLIDALRDAMISHGLISAA